MTKFTVTKPDGSVVPGLEPKDVGRLLLTAAGDWHATRGHDRLWALVRRNAEGWHAADLRVDAENEEIANQMICEVVARIPTWTEGYKIEPEAAEA